MARVRRLGVLALVAAVPALAPGAESPLAVRASPALIPCVAAAARGYGAARVSVRAGGFRELSGADVFVGADVEVTRALESGAALLKSEVDIASVPWVLAVAPGNPAGLRSAADLKRAAGEVWVLGGLAGATARRTLADLDPERVRASEDGRALRSAPIALIPLSLAGAGERLGSDVPPFVARAVVAERAPHPGAARAFVRFLASEPGQRAFAACGATPP